MPLFEIKYVYKKNGGMHTAHNLAYKIIETELNSCIDSDDMLGEEAVKKILDFLKFSRILIFLIYINSFIW